MPLQLPLLSGCQALLLSLMRGRQAATTLPWRWQLTPCLHALNALPSRAVAMTTRSVKTTSPCSSCAAPSATPLWRKPALSALTHPGCSRCTCPRCRPQGDVLASDASESSWALAAVSSRAALAAHDDAAHGPGHSQHAQRSSSITASVWHLAQATLANSQHS